MKCEWRRKLKERHRGDWCLMEENWKNVKDWGRLATHRDRVRFSLCGCGGRTPPNIKYRRRVARRRLQDELRDTGVEQ